MPPRKRRPVARATGVASVPPVTPVRDWIITKEWTRGKDVLTPGDEFSVTGENTRYRFIRHVARPNGAEWVDAIGDTGFRSFRPDRIRRIYRDRKTTGALAAVHKAKVKAKGKAQRDGDN